MSYPLTIRFFTTLILSGSALLTSCLSPKAFTQAEPCEIAMSDGSRHHSLDRPQLVRETGYYKFQNATGKDQVVPASQVAWIRPQRPV